VTDKAVVLAALAQSIATDVQRPLPLRLCQACRDILDADGGAITVAYTRPERTTLCATDETAARLEDLQEVVGQGPGPDAFGSGMPVVAALGAEEQARRWPLFARAASDSIGTVAIYALPIRPQTDVLGVLTLYQTKPRPLGHQIDVAQFMADTLGASILSDPAARSALIPAPWSARARIHQATGVIVAQLKIGPEDAMALLRAHAYAHDSTLDVVAIEVIERRLDFTVTDQRSEDT
jgi:hypothetical protein